MKVFVHSKAPDTFRFTLANLFGAVQVATEADTAKLSMVICVQWEKRHRREAIRGTCTDCGCAIAHMPHAPTGPPKVCWACAVKRVP